MKKQYLIVIACFLSALFCLAACGMPSAKTGETFLLTSVFLDGEPEDQSSLYPNGGSVTLKDGKGELILGDQSCDFSYTESDGSLSFSIHNIAVTGSRTPDEVELTFGDTGLMYHFSKDGSAAAEEENSSEESAPSSETALQTQWNGAWTGRFYIDEASGEWSDYLYRSMSATAEINVDENGEGTLNVYCPVYSDSVPILTLNITASEEAASNSGGYCMEDLLNGWDTDVQYLQLKESELRTTSFIDATQYIWYTSDPYADSAEEKMVSVVEINGSCKDREGGISYQIQLIRPEE